MTFSKFQSLNDLYNLHGTLTDMLTKGLRSRNFILLPQTIAGGSACRYDRSNLETIPLYRVRGETEYQQGDPMRYPEPDHRGISWMMYEMVFI